MDYSIKIEMLALLLNLIVMLFHFDKRNHVSKRYHIFSFCLAITTASIVLDIFTIVMLENALYIPTWIHYVMNTLYFAVIYVTFSITARYCFYVLFEYTSDDWCLTRASYIIIGLCLFLYCVLFVNIPTGILFSIQDGEYVRGPLNKVGYVVLLIEVAMLCMCYYRHRQTASRSVRRLIEIIPTLVLVLVMVQFVIPKVLLNGIISSLVNIILFISFQSNKIGQDDLTKLYNRVSFFQDFSYLRHQDQSFHLILIHLDDYDSINRKYGVENGDQLLFHIARYLEDFDGKYRAYRVGNTRFLLLGSHIAQEDYDKTVQTIFERFRWKWTFTEGECFLNVSIAHMGIDNPKDTENQIVSQLEYALTKSREINNNSIVFFDKKLGNMYERNTYVLQQVKIAIEKESFEVYFQPLYDCLTQSFTTAESLLRLKDEEGQSISPGEFIPLAEKTGLIDDISWIVLKKVFSFLSTHPNLPIQSISVNLTMEQLADKTFIKKLHEWQREFNVPFEKIRIEITERSIAKNYQLVKLTMHQLVSEGLKFYLDDFGVGYSNLSNMVSLPFETVKLDMSLVQEIDKDSKKYRIVKYLSQMLHSVGFKVVAECVERKEESEKIQELGIERIQGFYYAKPMPEDEYVEFLKNSLK